MPEWRKYHEDEEVEFYKPFDRNFRFVNSNDARIKKKNKIYLGRLVLIDHGAEWAEEEIEEALERINEFENKTKQNVSNLFLKFYAFSRTERKSNGWRDYDANLDYLMKIETLKKLSKRLGLPKPRLRNYMPATAAVIYYPRSGGSIFGVLE